MSLTIQAAVLRAVANGYETRAKVAEDEGRALLLTDMALANRIAAEELDEASRAQAIAFAREHACTVDHAKMTTQICPCCGVRRGK